MKLKRIAPLSGSLALHFIAFIALVFSDLKSPSSYRLQDPKQQVAPLEFSLMDKDQTSTRPREHGGSARGVARPLALSRFGLPLFGFNQGKQSTLDAKEGSAMPYKEGVQNPGLDPSGKGDFDLKTLFDRINPLLPYPLEFTKKQITGSVQGSLTFSLEGEYLESLSNLDSNSPYLRVLVAQTLRKAFAKGPIAFRSPPQKGKYSFPCSFVFDRVEPMDQTPHEEKSKPLVGALQFYRYFVRSIVQWELGPLKGVGPFPNLDLLWIPKKIEEALSNKAKFDPLDKYRDDPAW